MKHLLLSLLLISMVVFSCRREEDFITDSSAQLEFSTDSVLFDTVFTTIGSATKNIRVYNPHKEAIRISSITLKNGIQSNFRINVDGASGNNFRDVEIASEDSMFIFIEVTVDPNNQLNPFILEDGIVFNTNNNRQEVILTAWGQNAIYFTPKQFNRNLPDISCLTGPNNSSGPCARSIPPVDVTWTDSLPYVVYGYVALDSLDKLTIEAGANIHFHPGGGLWVSEGATLVVNGSKDKPVTFQGDRLEPGFSNRPGQWDRIWINEGGQHIINHAIIKNAFVGLQIENWPFEELKDTINIDGDISISNTWIDNCSGFGLLSALFRVSAQNLIITNCGEYNVALQSAGIYKFTHCTFANYFDQGARETPAFFVQNSYVNALGQQVILPANVEVYNSIIDGAKAREFEIEIINNGSLNLDFQNVAIKTDAALDTVSFKNITYNAQSIFKNIAEKDFSLEENSPVINLGNLSFANQVPLDFNKESRVADGMPDLGAIEFKP